MKKALGRRFVQLSVAVSLIAHSILFSANPPDHIFSLTENTVPSGNARQVIQPQTERPMFNDKADATDTYESAWEKGWEVEVDTNQGDIETFFPLQEPVRSTVKFDNAVKKESEQATHYLSPAERLFSLSQEEKNTHSLSQENDSPFKGKTDHDYYLGEESKRQPADISSAVKQKASISKLDAGAPIEPKSIRTTAQKTLSQIPTTIGNKTVAVEPFYDVQKRENIKSQKLTAEKKAYKEDAPQEPFWGLFGPQKPKIKEEKAALSGKSGKNTDIAYQPSSKIIAQIDPIGAPGSQAKTPPRTILINFNNVSIIEYIRFISRITNKNFVFDDADLQFNVTVISEEPTTIENVMTALIQELRIHGLSLIEQGNNLIIHRNADVNSISRVSVNGADAIRETELVTQVFKLNTLDPDRARTIVAPLVSKQALIEISDETRHIVITDLVTNIKQIEILFKSIDSPNSGLVIGQYVVRNTLIDNLIDLAEKIMDPIAQGQPLQFVPHNAAKSIFVVSTPFLVERTISVLQHLDQFQGATRIYDLEELKFKQLPADGRKQLPALDRKTPAEGETAPPVVVTPEDISAPAGRWELAPDGGMIFRPGFPVAPSADQIPQGNWTLDMLGRWYFLPEGTKYPFEREGTPPGLPGGPIGFKSIGEGYALLPGEAPKGKWLLDPQGAWIFQLPTGAPLQPERLNRAARLSEDLPMGHIDRTKFFIYKLQFRRGTDIVTALQQIGESLQHAGTANDDLALTIESVQWLEASNALVFTGTEMTLLKVKELVEEIDRTQRQVFIEMLILETTIDDSLTYGVSWGTRSGGGNTATSQAFLGGASPLVGALSSAGVGTVPTAATLATTVGYHLGVIGQRLTHNGTQFASLGALVAAVHQRGQSNIVLNPKIITEDNKTAEIFVGINTPFQTQAVANDEGSIITSNFEFRDVGTTLRVTPLIGNSDIITLEIEQEFSRAGDISNQGGGSLQSTSPGPTTSVNRTSTVVHIPNKHFVIISGMMHDEKVHNRNQFPCLGGIPLIGAAFSDKNNLDAKRNLMIFIRPEIVDTGEQYRDITRSQQEIWKQKNRVKKEWKYEMDEGMDLLNIGPNCCDECD